MAKIPRPAVVRLPGVRQPVGAGDVMARMLDGVIAWQNLRLMMCGPCARRREALNRILQFRGFAGR